MPTEDLKCPKRQEKPPSNPVRQKEKEKEGMRTGPALQGGSCEGGKVPAPWEGFSPAEKLDWMEREIQSLRGESSNQSVQGKMETNLHRGLAPPPCTPQPEILLCWWWGGGWSVTQTPKLSSRERTRVRCRNTLKRSGRGN